MVEIDLLLGIFEELDLVIAIDQAAEAHADQTDEESAAVELAKQLLHHRQERVVRRGVRDAQLHGMRLKVRVADLHAHTGGELAFLPELGGKLLAHGDHRGFE